MTRTVLIVEDDRALNEALCETLALEEYHVLAANDGAGALEMLARHAVDMVLSDVQMPGLDGHGLLRRIRADRPELPVLMMTAYGTIPRAVEAMRLGAVDYLAKPFEAEALLAAVRRHMGVPTGNEEPVMEDPASQRLFGLARRVAQSEATILITGESGTGKEVLARYLYRHSRRGAGPFIAINCAAIPENMLEATLFGYEKGAYTGAVKAMAGKFEQAEAGTLLLDEVSEMDLGLQAKLLRVLQEKEVERLGGGRLIKLDVRVLATSNRDLKAEVAAGRFREDLYYRLNVFPLHLPPLRERPGDIPELARRALARAARGSGGAAPLLTDAALGRLCAHPWPGNVRELDNVMQRTAILVAEAEAVTPDDLLFETPSGSAATPPAAAAGGSLDQDIRSHEYRIILDALREGSRGEAAERLGISPRTLRYKLAQMRDAGIAVPG